MSRPVLSLPVRQLDLFSITKPACAGSARAAALPLPATSLTSDARRKGGKTGPASVLVVLKRRRPVDSWLAAYIEDSTFMRQVCGVSHG